jgi:hypothetical protein
MSWMKLLHLGDVSLTFAVAAALAAWLLAAGAWRSAALWSLLFALGVGLVAASKIAFMGWGSGLPAIGFKAFSGHAMGATAVLPTLFYVLLYRHGPEWRSAGAVGGLGLGALVALQLVVAREHTVAEALAGWVLGALVSLGGLRLARSVEVPQPFFGLGCAALVFAGGWWLLQSAPLGYWMYKAALVLSGRGRPFSWDTGV